MAAKKGNKFWMLANWGKKAFYNSPEELETKITEYFTQTYKRGKFTPTVSGMTFYLGFESRSSLADYCKRDEAYSYIIHKAKKFIENCYEGQLYTQSSSGAVFALKNMGWKDKTETDITTGGEKLNLGNYSDEELAILEELLNRENKG